MHVLIVDDDDFALIALENTVTKMGYEPVIARDGQEAMTILRRGEIRLVITDWDMPAMTGVDLCRAVRQEELSGYVYIIMLTGRQGTKLRMEGLCAGADDFLTKPLDPEELAICLKTSERILGLETRELALFAMAKLAESRDCETGAHIERVQAYARLIAEELSPEAKSHYGVDDEYIRLLAQACPLHDLGKVAIPDRILLKPSKLSSDEFEVMKTHTTVGAQTLGAALSRFPNARFLQMAHQIALTHHEKFDGSGYPQGLAGAAIPLCGRIVALADVYDLLTSRRVYKLRETHDQAKEAILKSAGSHFDPEIVEAFIRAEDRFLKIGQRLCDPVDARAKPPVEIPQPPVVRVSRSIKILVVEDDSAILAKLVELLSATGEEVYSATNGEEALQIIADEEPRLIISDWVMPAPDGVELCRRIRSEQAGTEPVHFIMLTAHSEKDRLLDAYSAGVDDFVSKPFDPEELLARVRAGIRSAKLHDQLLTEASQSQTTNAELAMVNSRLERLSITDELTGLFNRRHAMFRLEEQWGLAQRYGKPVTIAAIDIDHFKQINDIYGHDAGDAVLRQLAGILRDATRGTDALCRVGGEEFLIIFPSQTLQEAHICAERCRFAAQEYEFRSNHANITATVSIGVASRTPAMGHFTDLLKAADEALYAAKHAGRNRVEIAKQRKDVNAMESPKVPATESNRPPIDFAAVLKRCGGDAKFAAAVSARFQSNAKVEVAKIDQALAAGNVENLRRAAHTLKSMAAYMAADVVSELARQIEELGRAEKLAEVPPLAAALTEEVTRAMNWLAQNSASMLTKVA